MAVPFEALDVQLGRRIDLQVEHLYRKVVVCNRGGYCYELNYLFHWLLQSVGFESDLIAASVFDGTAYGPEFDHLALVVHLDGLWLADVGYGDLFLQPLSIQPGVLQEDSYKIYQLQQLHSEHYLLRESLNAQAECQIRYQFSTIPRTIGDFEAQNAYKQTAEDSYFVKNRICTVPTIWGRKTLLNGTYKVRNNEGVEVADVREEELKDLLKKEFNIDLNEEGYHGGR